MNQLPKLKEFKAPEGYFDQLPDQILAKAKKPKSRSWLNYAAAAAFLIGIGLSWQYGLFYTQEQILTAEEEAMLYIESQVWSTEDILSMTEDPNGLLDLIIQEEMPPSEELWAEDELNWF